MVEAPSELVVVAVVAELNREALRSSGSKVVTGSLREAVGGLRELLEESTERLRRCRDDGHAIVPEAHRLRDRTEVRLATDAAEQRTVLLGPEHVADQRVAVGSRVRSRVRVLTVGEDQGLRTNGHALVLRDRALPSDLTEHCDGLVVERCVVEDDDPVASEGLHAGYGRVVVDDALVAGEPVEHGQLDLHGILPLGTLKSLRHQVAAIDDSTLVRRHRDAVVHEDADEGDLRGANVDRRDRTVRASDPPTERGQHGLRSGSQVALLLDEVEVEVVGHGSVPTLCLVSL